MALSSTSKGKILFYLGYPGNTLVSTSINYNTGVEDRLNSLTAYMEVRVSTSLASLDAVDEKLECAQQRLAARKVDTIETNADNEIPMLKRERWRLICELAAFLDLVPRRTSGGTMVNVCQ